MEIIGVEVKTTLSVKMGWETIPIMPVGDLQLGAPGADRERFRKHIEWGLENGAYFLGMGDYVDVASPSNRQTLRSIILYDSIRDELEESAHRLNEDFLSLVAGTEGRWLGLLEGHHFYEFRDGTTSDMELAKALKAPMLGTCAIVILKFQAPNSKKRMTCHIWCHHGAGGGQAIASPLTKLEKQMIGFDADIYLMGHHHKKVSIEIDQLYATRRQPHRLAHRTKLLAGTGGFLQGYLQGSKEGLVPRGSYVEQAMMTPVALGGILIKVTPEIQAGGVTRLDIKVEK